MTTDQPDVACFRHSPVARQPLAARSQPPLVTMKLPAGAGLHDCRHRATADSWTKESDKWSRRIRDAAWHRQEDGTVADRMLTHSHASRLTGPPGQPAPPHWQAAHTSSPATAMAGLHHAPTTITAEHIHILQSHHPPSRSYRPTEWPTARLISTVVVATALAAEHYQRINGF